jgi:hypothetical protein
LPARLRIAHDLLQQRIQHHQTGFGGTVFGSNRFKTLYQTGGAFDILQQQFTCLPVITQILLQRRAAQAGTHLLLKILLFIQHGAGNC